MWNLVKAQFRYHWQWMALVLVPLLIAAALLTGTTAKSDKIGGIWMLWTLIGGMLTQIAFYHQDLSERRPLLWLELPVSPSKVVGARLIVPLFIHLPMLAVALAAVALLLPEAWSAKIVGEILAGNGLAMLVSYSIYAGEEVGIRLMGRRFAFWLAQFGFSALLVFVALDPLEWFPDLEEAGGVAGLHVVASLFAFAAYRMFLSRSSFLVGTDPSCGLPVDWSSSD